jgi:hypothetical protein
MEQIVMQSMLDIGQPPQVSEKGGMGPLHEEGGPNPCPEDKEIFNIPRIVMMFPWRTVGMPAPRSSSPAISAQRMEDFQKPNLPTGPDDLKVNQVFFSTFEELTLPIKGPMEDTGRLSDQTV